MTTRARQGAVSLRRGGALLLSVALLAAACGETGTAAPTSTTAPPAPTAPPSGQASTDPARESSTPVDAGAVPVEPPAGAETIAAREGVDDGVPERVIVYRVPADVADVRAHYRERLRASGWMLIDVELDEGAWELEWRLDARELEVDIRREAGATIVELTLSGALGG